MNAGVRADDADGTDWRLKDFAMCGTWEQEGDVGEASIGEGDREEDADEVIILGMKREPVGLELSKACDSSIDEIPVEFIRE